MAIPSKEYWALRAVRREEEAFARGAELSMRLYNAYQQAVREMRRAVNDFYVRYARENKLTYEEAVRALNRAEAREWKAMLGEWVERIRAEPDPRIRERLTAELDALSYRSRMDRLDALSAQARMTMDELYARSMREMAEEFGEVYRESFYKKSFDLQSRAGRYRPIAKVDAAMIENVMSYPWSGANFSDRLWQNKEALLFNIRQDLTQGLIRGTGLPVLSRDLAERMGQSYKAAERLVRTEVNHFHNEADKAAYRAAGVEWYEFMATLDARTCAVCGELDGKRFQLSEARTGENYPPMHPNDRCTTVEWDPEGEADWSKSGKPMPEGMTYEEWRKRQRSPLKSDDDGAGEEHGPEARRARLNVRTEKGALFTDGRRTDAVVYSDGRMKLYIPADADLARLAASPEEIFDAASEIPQNILDFVDRIEVLDSANPMDSFWAKEYNIPGFRSAATGGDGVITLYQRSGRETRGQLVHRLMHESGHIIDQEYVGGRLSESEWYLSAVKVDSEFNGGRFPSDYAEKAFMETGLCHEDFAEGLSYYLAAREQCIARFPNRSTLYEEVLKWRKE